MDQTHTGATEWDAPSAGRRIAQLEAALSRRGELLEQKSVALANIHASRAWKLVLSYYKLRDRLMPPCSVRREWAKHFARLGLAALRRLVRLARPVPGATAVPADPDRITPTPSEYARWVAKYEPRAAELERQRRHKFGRAPKFSVLVPVYNPPAQYLDEMVRSVLDQTYAGWQLVLADGASTAAHVRPALERYAKSDPRVTAVFLETNAGIVGNSNAGLAHCAGDFVALLDHDDTLAPFALHELAAAVNADPAADFLYSDEDKLDRAGRRVEPNMKPDWSPHTLRAYNYVCHLVALRRDLLESLGGFRHGFDGAQDYDLVLRAGERARSVVHVPKVLYHWRMHEQSTAANKGSKSYAFDAGKRAVREHLERCGVRASVVDGTVPGLYQTVYHTPARPKVSVIIPNRDQAGVLSNCLASLERTAYENYELIVVENNSTQADTFALYRNLSKRPGTRVLTWDKPFNYAAVNNFAAAHAAGELLLFLNNDVEAIDPGWMEEMVGHATQPGVGAVGAKLLYPDDTLQHAGIILGMGGIAGHDQLNFPRSAPGYMRRLQHARDCAAVTGACLKVKKSAFDEVGGFDEGFVLAFNDVDLCVQLLGKGYRNVWTPGAELYHLESKTRGYEDTPEKQKRFAREVALFRAKWQHLLDKGDPFTSPHFRLDRADYCLKG